MATSRSKAELVLCAEERTQLSALAASRSLPHAMVARARGGLPTVGKWSQRLVRAARGRPP
jgi:hypothetical protein